MSDDFRAAQRRYWESKGRFADPRARPVEAFVRPKLAWATRQVPVDRETSVLDVGAGNGTFTWYWAQAVDRVVGVDFSSNLLHRSPCPGRMVQADISGLPFADRQFDVVFSGNVLHHAGDPVAVLREMARVCRGHLVLVEPNRWHPPMSAFMAINRSERRGLRFDVRYIGSLASDAGLEVVAAAPQGAIYPNQTPSWLVRPLVRFDRPSRWGAYVVAVLVHGSAGVTTGQWRRSSGRKATPPL